VGCPPPACRPAHCLPLLPFGRGPGGLGAVSGAGGTSDGGERWRREQRGPGADLGYLGGGGELALCACSARLGGFVSCPRAWLQLSVTHVSRTGKCQGCKICFAPPWSWSPLNSPALDWPHLGRCSWGSPVWAAGKEKGGRELGGRGGWE
jgi:hypothetical protein